MIKQLLFSTIFLYFCMVTLQAQDTTKTSNNKTASLSKKKNGIGILTSETPSHSNSEVDNDFVYRFDFKKDSVKIKQYDKYSYYKNKFNLIYNSTLGIENCGALPEIQNKYAQGQSSGGALQWFGPETGEIFSWGPLLKDLEFDGSAYAYDKNGCLVPLGAGDGVPAKAYGFDNFFRAGFVAKNDVLFNMFLRPKRRHYIEAGIGQYLRNSPIRNSDFESYNTLLSVKDIYYEKESHVLNANVSVGYNTAKGKLLNQGANLSSMMGSLLTTPPSFDNSNSLSAKEAASGRQSWQLPDGSMRSFSPGNSDNPYAFLNALPDTEKDKQAFAGFTITHQKRFKYVDVYDYYSDWNKLTTTIKGNFQYINNERANGTPAGFSAYDIGRFSQQKITTKTGEAGISSTYITRTNWENRQNLPFTFIGSYLFNYEQKDLNYQNSQGFLSDNYDNYRASHELTYGIETEYSFTPNLLANLQLTSKNYFSNTINNYSNFYPYAKLVLFYSSSDQQGFSFIFNAGKTMREAALIYNDPAVLSILLPSSEFNRYFESQALYANHNLKPEIKGDYSANVGYERVFNHQSAISIKASYQNTTTSNLVLPIYQADRFILENTAKTNYAEWSVFANYKKRSHYYRTRTALGFEVSAKWAKYSHKVLETTNNQYIPTAGFSNISTGILKGNPVDAIYGTTWLRDEQGRKIIGNDGFPLVNNALSMIGDPTPDWTLQLSPLFHWRRFSIGFTLLLQVGGDKWNGTAAALDYLGMSQTTADQRNTTGYVFEGVTTTGQPNTIAVDFYDPGQAIENNRWVRYGMAGVGEEYICDATSIRLSKINVEYTIPLKRSRLIHELIVGLSAYNLFVFSKYDGVDPSSTLYNSASGVGLDLFNIPAVRSFMFNLKMGIGK